MNSKFQKIKANNKTSKLKSFSLNSVELENLSLTNRSFKNDDNSKSYNFPEDSVLNVDLTTDYIDMNTNFNVKDNLNYYENNIFNEIKQVYVDEQRRSLTKNFGSFEKLNSDLTIVQSLELQVIIFIIIFSFNNKKKVDINTITDDRLVSQLFETVNKIIILRTLLKVLASIGLS